LIVVCDHAVGTSGPAAKLIEPFGSHHVDRVDEVQVCAQVSAKSSQGCVVAQGETKRSGCP
jgi:hypothetical protein